MVFLFDNMYFESCTTFVHTFGSTFYKSYCMESCAAFKMSCTTKKNAINLQVIKTFLIIIRSL